MLQIIINANEVNLFIASPKLFVISSNLFVASANLLTAVSTSFFSIPSFHLLYFIQMVFIKNPAIVLTTIAGITTVINNTLKGAGKPTRSNADAKKTIPDTKVPTALTTIIFILLCSVALSSNLISKYTNIVVIILSNMFGTRPKGNFVVRPLKIPVATPDAKQVLKLLLFRLIIRIKVIREKSICIESPNVGVT